MDSEQLARCKAGDPEAIGSLVQEHKTRIYRLCLSVLDDPADAEDATQESFIAALKSLDKYRGDSAFHTWLYAIALNTCRGNLRQRKRRQALDNSLAEVSRTEGKGAPSPEKEMLETEKAEALWHAINNLDEKHRLPIILRYYHELSTQEIADTLGVNLGTIHSRLSIARDRLSGELKRAEGNSLAGKGAA